MTKQNKIKVLTGAVFLLIAGLFVHALIFSVIQKPQKTEESEVIENINTSKWVYYENKEYGIKLQYPQNWELRENTIDTSLRGTTQFLPSKLNNFPECQKRASELLKNSMEQLKVQEANPNTYALPLDYDDLTAVYSEIKSSSCSLGIRVEENAKHLPVKEYLKEKFFRGNSTPDQSSINYIESLLVKKDNDIEKISLDRSFYYISGFGGKNEVEEVIPYFSTPNEQASQFIIAKGNVIIFVNNNINKQDLLMSENKDIFKNFIETIEFL